MIDEPSFSGLFTRFGIGHHFAGVGHFAVSITSISKRFGYGAHQHGISERLGYEVSGIITYPKYIQVTLEICKPEWKEFGSWRYDTLDPDSKFPRPEFPFPITVRIPQSCE